MKTMEIVWVQSDDIKGNEMDKTCNTHGKDEKWVKVLVGRSEKKSDRGKSSSGSILQQ